MVVNFARFYPYFGRKTKVNVTKAKVGIKSWGFDIKQFGASSENCMTTPVIWQSVLFSTYHIRRNICIMVLCLKMKFII